MMVIHCLVLQPHWQAQQAHALQPRNYSLFLFLLQLLGLLPSRACSLHSLLLLCIVLLLLLFVLQLLLLLLRLLVC
jgi:hypothetical protein